MHMILHVSCLSIVDVIKVRVEILHESVCGMMNHELKVQNNESPPVIRRVEQAIQSQCTLIFNRIPQLLESNE